MMNSVLSIVSKLIEHHIKEIVEQFLRENAPTSTRQWGFMMNRSTVSVLIKIVDDWLYKSSGPRIQGMCGIF